MFIGLPRAPQIVAILLTCLALSFAGGAMPPAAAQDVASGVRVERSLPDVLEEITPAVVNIAVTSRASAETNPLSNDPYFRRFFDLPQIPQQRPARLGQRDVSGYAQADHLRLAVDPVSEQPASRALLADFQIQIVRDPMHADLAQRINLPGRERSSAGHDRYPLASLCLERTIA
jgi:S1-C subfamily serine protease